MIGSISGYGQNPYAAYSASFSNKPVMANGLEKPEALMTAAEKKQVEESQERMGIEKDGRVSPSECETCKNRKYKDGSNEQVSFKTPTHISPQASAAAVASHEGEHVANAYAKAEKSGGEVLQASVSYTYAVCPECGTSYVAGGLTRTTISTPVDDGRSSNPYAQQAAALKGIENNGRGLDVAV